MEKQVKAQETYFPPRVEIMELTVEKGFAVSEVYFNTGNDQLGIQTEWNTGGEGESFF